MEVLVDFMVVVVVEEGVGIISYSAVIKVAAAEQAEQALAAQYA